jgi:ABC-type nitrate/sulfonate/bicarbonate transport system substrate-binding protein
MSKKALWYTRCPVPTAFSVALRNGWLDEEFEADGIEVSSLLKSTDRSVRESHFDHTLADSFRHGGNTPPIWSRAKGNDVRLIGLSWTEQPQFLLTRPETGIKTAADLKGKRLALPRRPRDSIDFTRANYLQFYETALASVGLGLKDVQLVDITVDRAFLDESGAPTKDGSLWNAVQLRASQREEIAAYWRGEVDVIASAGPRGLENKALLGAHIVHDISQQKERIAKISNSAPYTFTVSGRLLKERPELVARLLARVLEAAEWAKTHHDEAVRVVAQELGVAEEFVVEAFGDKLSQQLEVDLSADNVAAIRLRKDFLLRHGFLPADFDLDQWIDPTPLVEAQKIVRERAQQRKQNGRRQEPALAPAE